MKKKLQVFVSSTYIDLIEERQAAVEEILKKGHIPAGMELFNAGSESQKTTIKRWIEESDVYMLILGGRYGSIEPEDKKSYTHWEYDYAGEIGKPRFALVISEEALDLKGRQNKDFFERKYYNEYEAFKSDVLSRMSKFFSDTKDIRLGISGSLDEIVRLYPDLPGWISGKDIPNVIELEEHISRLQEENERMKWRINEQETMSSMTGHTNNGIKGKKLKYLWALYKVTDGNKRVLVYNTSVGLSIGLSEEESRKFSDNLSARGLLKHMALGGGISITDEGIFQIEEIIEPISELSELETYILMNFENSVDVSLKTLKEKFDVESMQEIAFNVLNLEKKGLISYTQDPFIRGGMTNPKYKNNVTMIMFDQISLTEKAEIALNLIRE